MGLFDRLFGRGRDASPPQSDLRRALFDAALVADPAALTRLCRDNQAEIVAQFDAWRKVPDEVRRDPQAMQRYAQGLIGVARSCAEELGEARPLQMLMGPAADNPITRWQATLQKAKALTDDDHYEEAARLLSEELGRVRALSGGESGRMQAITLARLAQCHFDDGRAGEALPLLREALELCRAERDEEGVLAYLTNLFEVHRYLGQPSDAAAAATELAELLEKAGKASEARRFRKHAEIIRRGEPRNRTVIELDGELYELDEAASLPVSGRFRVNFCRDRISPARAVRLMERGRALGSAGKYEEALAAFREAGKVDPHSPDAPFQEAVTWLHMGRAAEAAARYEQVEALAPGWFHCRAELRLARDIAAGTRSIEEFHLLRALEDSALPAEEKVALARAGLKRAPDRPELYLELGRQLAALGQRDEARRALASGLERASEPNVRSRLLTTAAALEEPSQERDRWLHEAIEMNGDLTSTAMAMLMLRGSGAGVN